MHIIFVNRYFHPDYSATSQMLSDLAFALADRGKRISIITSRQLYDTPKSRLASREFIAGVEVFRVWTSRFGRHNLAGRAIDYLTFYISAAWKLWQVARRGDLIIAKTDPPMLFVVTGPVARMRRASLVNWLQDLFPEVLEALDVDRNFMRRMAYKFMRALRNRSLQQAQMNIVIGERMAERLTRSGVPPEHIRIIPNWADGALVTPYSHAAKSLRQEWGLEDKFVVGYSGNLGRAHEVDTLIDAIARLEQDCNTISAGREESCQKCEIAWLFIGGGALYGQLQTEIAARGLSSVHFRPYQPRECLGESLSVPDIHLVSLRPELEGLIVPSKYFGIAAAGRPTIFVGDADGEIARILKAEGGGQTVALGDDAGLAALIRTFVANPNLAQEMGRRGRSAFERCFDLPIAISAWEKVLAATASNSVEHPAGFTQNLQSTRHYNSSNDRRGRRG